MPYRVIIQNQRGEPLPGIIYFYDAAGTEFGMATVAPGGSDIDVEADSYRITSPGYFSITAPQLYQESIFELVRSVSPVVYVAAGALALFAFLKLFKVRL